MRLYETGYLVNFYKTSTPEARAWSERSRGEYLGLYPYYTLGGLGDRNWSYDANARVQRPVGAPSPTPSPKPRPSRTPAAGPGGSGGPAGQLPRTGGAVLAAATGVAALGVAAVTARTQGPAD